MHIGFDISQTGSGKTGCGYFAHGMIEALMDLAPEHAYTLYPSFGALYFNARMPFISPYSGKNVTHGPRYVSLGSAKKFWNNPNLGAVLKHPDIIQANNFWCPSQSLTSRVIYTCHDLNFTIDSSWSTKMNQANCFEGVFRSAIYADWIVAVSHATRLHYLKVFPHFPPERIRVIYPCSRFKIEELQGKRPTALGQAEVNRFWLCVGTLEPRKNLRFLVKAYARYLALGGDPMPLVLAGGKGWLMEDFQADLKALGLGNNVKLLGYVTDAELIWLYQHCYANCYPSLFEGFGLPVLEGMQCGAPTLISSNTSLPEVGGEAAIQIPPDDLEGWAYEMLVLSKDKDKCDTLSHLSFEQSKMFDGRKSAKGLLTLYEEAISLPKRSLVRES